MKELEQSEIEYEMSDQDLAKLVDTCNNFPTLPEDDSTPIADEHADHYRVSTCTCMTSH